MYNKERENSGRITGRALRVLATMRGFWISAMAVGTTAVRLAIRFGFVLLQHFNHFISSPLYLFPTEGRASKVEGGELRTHK